jgi:hypothetical protein
MMMDVYHPDFWESIAIDTRVQHVGVRHRSGSQAARRPSQ